MPPNQSDRRETFRQLVRALRQSADLSTMEVAAALGTTPVAVTQWETRGSIPRKRATVEKLERLYGVTDGSLVALSHPRPAPTPAVAPDALPDLLAMIGAVTATVDGLAAEVAEIRSQVAGLTRPAPEPARPSTPRRVRAAQP